MRISQDAHWVLWGSVSEASGSWTPTHVLAFTLSLLVEVTTEFQKEGRNQLHFLMGENGDFGEEHAGWKRLCGLLGVRTAVCACYVPISVCVSLYLDRWLDAYIDPCTSHT